MLTVTVGFFHRCLLFTVFFLRVFRLVHTSLTTRCSAPSGPPHVSTLKYVKGAVTFKCLQVCGVSLQPLKTG